MFGDVSRRQCAIVDGHFIDFAFEVGSAVMAASDEHPAWMIRRTARNFPGDLGRVAGVQEHPNPLPIAHHHDVVPCLGLDFGLTLQCAGKDQFARARIDAPDAERIGRTP